MNGIHRQSIVRPRLPLLLLLFFLYFLMHICLLIIIFSSFFFFSVSSLCISNDNASTQEIYRIVLLMVRTPTILFVELSSRGLSQSERNECYPVILCIEKRREKKTRDNTKKRQRKREKERRRYVYVYKPSASLILVRRAQKATRQICLVSPCVCVLKRFYSGK